MECYSTMKKDSFPFVITWMDLENIMLRDINQIEKDKYYKMPLIHGNLKKLNL